MKKLFLFFVMTWQCFSATVYEIGTQANKSAEYVATLWIKNTLTSHVRNILLETNLSQALSIGYLEKNLYIAGENLYNPCIWVCNLSGKVVKKILPDLSSSEFSSIQVFSNQIYVTCNIFDGEERSKVLALDLDGSILKSWDLPIGSGYSASHASFIKMDGTQIYACGEQFSGSNNNHQGVLWIIDTNADTVANYIPLSSNTKNETNSLDFSDTQIFLSAHKEDKPTLLILSKSGSLVAEVPLNQNGDKGKSWDVKLYRNQVFLCGESSNISNYFLSLWKTDLAGNNLSRTNFNPTINPISSYKFSILNETIFYAGMQDYLAWLWSTNLQGDNLHTFSLMKSGSGISFARDLLVKEEIKPALDDALQFLSPIYYQR